MDVEDGQPEQLQPRPDAVELRIVPYVAEQHRAGGRVHHRELREGRDGGRRELLRDAGNLDAARRALEAIARDEVPCHLEFTAVRAGLFLAEIESRLGHVTRAQERVLEALNRAEPLELARPFLERDVVRDLLVSGQGRFGHHEAFVRRLRAVDLPPALECHQEASRLTPAELLVLRELPSLLSLREIAQARSISVNTVKTHLRAVYRKLGVAGRREAVEVGRRRGLL